MSEVDTRIRKMLEGQHRREEKGLVEMWRHYESLNKWLRITQKLCAGKEEVTFYKRRHEVKPVSLFWDLMPWAQSEKRITVYAQFWTGGP